ncbi:MAG: DUF523 and DUF1722 domain-containing protein [Nitrospinae bacterium]|nr:DUF523 and DUF1722 domain-containing protein [Nitrospinota bacterium]
MQNKIKIGVSSCLVGEKVRWNGDHKQNHFVREVLAKYFEYVSICPEMEVGMGVPRETVGLYGTLKNPRMISKKTQTDWTKPMKRYIKDRISTLEENDLCGYIFKSKSPSCGLGRVPVYSEFGSDRVRHGPGIFADAFTRKFPLVPTEDEGRLNDPKIRENFIVKVFSFYRLQALFKKQFSLGALVKFHTQQKFLLLAHSRKHYDALGQLVAKPKSMGMEVLKEKYGKIFMEAFTLKATPKKNTDVLLHMMGFLKKNLSKREKEDILSTIEDYRKELLPLIVPITLIRHQVEKHDIEYLADQVYLNPHPKELMLRNHV